jgi:hypothetical protein
MTLIFSENFSKFETFMENFLENIFVAAVTIPENHPN